MNNEHLETLAVDAAPVQQPHLPPIQQPALTPEEIARVEKWCRANPRLADRWRHLLINDPKLRKAVLG
jgi:hypothetical protein